MSSYYQDENRYEDIIDLPHYQSKTRKHMPLHDRAAQFAPFAALNGYEDAIEETGRITEERITLDETSIEKINEELAYIASHLNERHMVSVTYFKPDSKKSGGAYLTDIGIIKKVDEVNHVLIMESGTKIFMEQMIDISELLEAENE